MMRFLSLGTYPSSTPRHGGQLRLNAIHRTLSKNGWETSEFAVCPPGAYPEVHNANGLLAMSDQFAAKLHHAGIRTDVGASSFVIENANASDALDHSILAFGPHVIALEQPWLWPALKDHFDRYGNRDRYTVIYSSQNVEEHLIKEELTISSTSGNAAEHLKSVQDIERSLAQCADGIVAVSKSDAAFFGNLNSNVIVAANGVWPASKPGGLKFWQDRFGGHRTALFVGSYHLPNGSGFCKCLLGDSLAYLAPDEKILIAGRVGELLKTMPAFRRHAGVNLARIFEAGVQDDAGLASLYQIADTVILPITEGGGTNIKTAEALVSNKRVVATKTAMRGYDAYLNISGITIADEADFPEALKASLLESTPLIRPVSQRRLLDSLLWSNTLEPLSSFFLNLYGKRQNRYPVGIETKRGKKLSVFLCQNWYVPEDNGAWSSATTAMLEIPLQEEMVRCTITFTGFPPNNGKQIVTLVNDSKVLDCFVIDNIDMTYEANFVLEAKSEKYSSPFEVAVVSSTLLSPAELDHSADFRKLGVRICKISFGSANSEKDYVKRPPVKPRRAVTAHI